MNIKQEISKEISNILKKDYIDIDKMITKNDSITRGNYSLPCFKFASELKDKPDNIANMIKENIKLDYIEKLEVIGGFLNIYIKRDFYIIIWINTCWKR